MAASAKKLAMETLAVIRGVLTSRTTHKSLVNMGLLVGSATILLTIATAATSLFFWHYLPSQSLSWPVYLQYRSGPNPGGATLLNGALLKSQQPYQVSVALTLSKSPANSELGNFMVGLYLMDRMPAYAFESGPYLISNDQACKDQDGIMFASRRPALVPYEDPLVSLASRIFFLPYSMLRRGVQPRVLTVPMAEEVLFERPTRFPAAIYLELEAGQKIQIYEAKVTLTAKLGGLRYVLHHYRLPAFITLVAAFWSLELIVTSSALFLLTAITGAKRVEHTTEPKPESSHHRKAELVTVKGEQGEHTNRGMMAGIPEFMPATAGGEKGLGPQCIDGGAQKRNPHIAEEGGPGSE